ncbi:putative nuclear transport factor 2 [Delitschia confertaspora ATCC 74209]|uniref:Nuclear transport factor 2 n=1 Tax=Delitschia confertaspora ATCC 74209 TaxID=1513339 RepID=A0A9P4JUF9_9PLEO|nr:putative nuclear transport factor 2 [Delitschia confertaspora ATCC 74209]
MADFSTIASEFVKFYYQTFDTNRAALGGLYRDTSMLTFEQQPFLGSANILEKLQNLPFQKVEHRHDTIDAQPGPEEGSIIVMVTGALMVEGSDRPMSFTQVFQLRPEAGSYYVFNDIFRLVYPAA